MVPEVKKVRRPVAARRGLRWSPLAIRRRPRRRTSDLTLVRPLLLAPRASKLRQVVVGPRRQCALRVRIRTATERPKSGERVGQGP